MLPSMIVVVILLIAAAVIKTVLGQKGREPQDYPYQREQTLFSPAERSFLSVLEQTVKGQYRFMGKVRLADVVKVKGGLSKGSRQTAFNRIQSKHVDIVACDPATLSIQFVVELDDSTHSQAGRQTRDQFVDKALHAAGIPVIHITAKRAYVVQDIHDVLSQAGVLAKIDPTTLRTQRLNNPTTP